MANTTPVTDTVKAAEHVLDLGRLAAVVDVRQVGPVTKGLAGHELAELALVAHSRARVRVFSDDGKCAHDAALMLRALEQVKAFGEVCPSMPRTSNWPTTTPAATRVSFPGALAFWAGPRSRKGSSSPAT